MLTFEVVTNADRLLTVREHLVKAQDEGRRGIIPMFSCAVPRCLTALPYRPALPHCPALPPCLTALPSKPRPLQRHVQQQPVLAVVQVQARELFDA